MVMNELVINKGFVTQESAKWLRKWWVLEEKE
jgi:hypothetical protein